MILGYESFDQTKAMLESADEADKVVAFEVLEQSDFKENMVYILILFKDTNVPLAYWEAHAPHTLRSIRVLYGLQDKSAPAMSLKGILKKAVQYGVAERQLNFLMLKYAEFFSSYLPPKFKVTITLQADEPTES